MWAKFVVRILVAGFLFFVAVSPSVANEDVVGVFGVTDFGDYTALALWIPVESGQIVEAIRWYNNDSDAAFDEVLAVAGVKDVLPPVSDATSVGVSVNGVNSGWSEFVFVQPLASVTDGFYLYFQMPEGSPFTHQGYGGGAGIGYCVGDGVLRSWLTGDGEYWAPIGAEYMMAVEPVSPVAKSALTNANVLVLGTDQIGVAVDVETPANELNQRRIEVYPNPFNPKTEIRFWLSSRSSVELTIFDVRGRAVKRLLQEEREAGGHVVAWDGRSSNGVPSPSGVYLARVKSHDGTSTVRMTLVQ